MGRKLSKPSKAAQEARLVLPYILWALIIGVWLLVVVSLASYSAYDWPAAGVTPYNQPTHNWVGPVGAVIAYQLYTMFGPGLWIMVAGSLAFMVGYLRKKPLSTPVLRIIGIVLMALMASALAAVTVPHLSASPEGTGGLVAISITTELIARFSNLGTMLILMVAFWIGAILAMDQIVLSASRWVGSILLALTRINWPKPVLVGALGGLRSGRGSPAPRAAAAKSGRSGTALADDEDDVPEVAAEVEEDDEEAEGAEAAPAKPSSRGGDKTKEEQDARAEAGVPAALEEDGPAHDAPGAYLAEKKQLSVDELRKKIKQLPINFAPASKAAPAAAPIIDLSGYRFPGADLLVEGEGNFTQEMERLVRDQAVELEEALQQYRIDGEVVGIHSGPVITLYEIKLAPGTKVSALNGVSCDLARALKAQNIRIVSNTAGKDTVGVEVPNIKKEKVRLKDLFTTHGEALTKMRLPMYLGKDASGNALIADLTEMPHMLIAGTTGSGKSVCMNSIIMSFMFAKRPDELRMVLVDPKMVELSMFKDIPHLMCPVVTEMSKAAAILEWATTKMDERYEILAEAAVRDIGSYNQLSWEEIKERFQATSDEDAATIPRKLPYIVIVIDELADLMLTNKEVEGHIVRLAQKARAVGIHLILATQRPQANVVTGLIKGNMPCRVSFKVASGLDSRIVLDQKGAELLLGQGDMLYLSPRSSKLTRAQGTLVDDLEIRRVVNFLKTVAQQSFEPQLVQLRGADAPEEDGEPMEKDPLFEDSVKIILESKRGSVSLLQRRLNIGYSRASRLIEQMFRAGILGEYKGSQAREVVMTLDEWEAIKAQAEADAATGLAHAANNADDDSLVPDEFEDEFKQ